MHGHHDPATQHTPQNSQAAIDDGPRGGQLSDHILQVKNSLTQSVKLAVYIGLIRQKFRAGDDVGCRHVPVLQG